MASTKVLYDTFTTRTQAETSVKALKTVWACGSRLTKYPTATDAEILDVGAGVYQVWLIVAEEE